MQKSDLAQLAVEMLILVWIHLRLMITLVLTGFHSGWMDGRLTTRDDLPF
jgi:hypothetical protein